MYEIGLNRLAYRSVEDYIIFYTLCIKESYFLLSVLREADQRLIAYGDVRESPSESQMLLFIYTHCV